MKIEEHVKKIAIGFYILAGFLGLSILYAFTGGSLKIFGLGTFLFRCFHVMALYIPAYLAATGYLLLQEPFSRKNLVRLLFSIIPFLTLTLFFHIVLGAGNIPIVQSFTTAFGKVLSAILLVCITGLEILIIFKLTASYFREEAKDSTWVNHEPLDSYVPPVSPVFEDSVSSRASWESENSAPMGCPDLPDPAAPLTKEELGPVEDLKDPEITRMIDRIMKGENLDAPASAAPIPPITDIEKVDEIPLTLEEDDATDISMETSINNAMDSSMEEYPVENIQEQLDPDLLGAEIPMEVEEDPGISFLKDQLDYTSSPSIEELEEEAVFPIEASDFNDQPFDNSDAEVDSLINSLDEVLEEDRNNMDISSKLSPDEPRILESNPMVAREFRVKKKRKEYKIPIEGILAEYPDGSFGEVDEATRRAGRVLEQTLEEFKIQAEVTGIKCGPVITMFELLPSPGVKLSKIVNLQDNIALRLAASRVRIVAPIPGKHAVGIEIPNKKRAMVSFSSILREKNKKAKDMELPFFLGKDIQGGNQVIDLTRTPHLLIAGATGSGKSVCVNSLICSLLYECHPTDVKLMLVDPKIVELKLYNDIPHLLTPVITETKKALQALQWCLYEMERRYSLLDTVAVRDIRSYNAKIKKAKLAREKMPYIVVIIDEFADLMATAGKELEGLVARLAAMSRAVGIHLVLATQRPSTDVITGLIKANFPSRIAFMVASRIDSRIIIDNNGAEKLLGKGDMLFTSSWDPFPSRLQGAFLSDEEVENICNEAKAFGDPEYIDEEIFFEDEDEQMHVFSDEADPLFDQALEIVVSSGKASASYLQRRLKIGYNRAARLVEEMEERGIVGPANGSKPRDVIYSGSIPKAEPASERPSLA